MTVCKLDSISLESLLYVNTTASKQVYVTGLNAGLLFVAISHLSNIRFTYGKSCMCP